MRTQPPNANRSRALLALGLVLALTRMAAAQEAEPSTPEGSAPGVEATEPGSTEAMPTEAPASDEEAETQETSDAEETASDVEEATGTLTADDEIANDEDEKETYDAEEAAAGTQEPVETGTAAGESTAETDAAAVESTVEPEGDGTQISARLPAPIEEAERFWQVLGLYELHFNLISDDYSANDWTSYYMVRGNVNVTRNNQLGLRLDLDQRYIADPGESGLWFGDIRLYYTRFFTLPIPDFPIPARAIAYLTAPTSRPSQERGIITQPTATLRLLPSWGPFTLVADYNFRYTFARWAESSHGATPNNMLSTGFMFWVMYTSPWEWFWPSALWQSTWSKSYSTRENDWQPWLEDYYFEVAANFTLPLPNGYPVTELSLAYAQGSSVLEDGVYRLYFAKRDQSQLYFSLSLTY